MNCLSFENKVVTLLGVFEGAMTNSLARAVKNDVEI